MGDRRPLREEGGHHPQLRPEGDREIALRPEDGLILALAARHRFVLGDHAAALLGLSRRRVAAARLAALSRAGLLSERRVFHGQPPCYRITRAGLRSIGSTLSTPRRLDLGLYAHDLGTAWLWLAARRGAFGPVGHVFSERELRSHDLRRRGPDEEPLAVRLAGQGPAGHPKLHYPDLLLHTGDGRRVALELELSGKGRARWERILAGYAVDRRIDSVIYLVDRVDVARGLCATVERMGLGGVVHVQRFRWGETVSQAVQAASGFGRSPGVARQVEKERVGDLATIRGRARDHRGRFLPAQSQPTLVSGRQAAGPSPGR